MGSAATPPETQFAATFYYLGKGLGNILARGGQSDLTRFMTNFACAIWECNCYDTTSVEWKHCHAMLLVFGYAAGMVGASVAFWGSVSELCYAVPAAATAAASRHFTSLAHLAQSCTKKPQTQWIRYNVFSVI